MSLSQIQQAFDQAIYANNGRELASFINGDEHFSVQGRINVYRNNTLGSLKETLKSTYPVCLQLVGDKYFDQLSRYFVSQTPSSHADLNAYGAEFPACLAKLLQQREELQPLPYLPDMARLEWALHRAYYAAKRQAFDVTAFTALTPDQQMRVSFNLAADIHLVQSDYPIYTLWQQHQVDSETDNINDQGFTLIVRDGLKPTALAIEAPLYHLLFALQQQLPLTGLALYLPQSPLTLDELIQKGWITGFKVAP